MEIATRYDIKCAPSIIERAVAIVTQYRKYALKAGVPDIWTAKIEEEIESSISLL